MKHITSDILRQKRACDDQIELFIELGGDRLELTKALCLKHANKFDWLWAGRNLLTPEGRTKFSHLMASARTEYDYRERLARTEYERIRKSVWAQFEPEKNPTLNEYLRIEKPARADYKRIERQLWAQYRRSYAAAFFQAWTSPENQDAEVAA